MVDPRCLFACVYFCDVLIFDLLDDVYKPFRNPLIKFSTPEIKTKVRFLEFPAFTTTNVCHSTEFYIISGDCFLI